MNIYEYIYIYSSKKLCLFCFNYCVSWRYTFKLILLSLSLKPLAYKDSFLPRSLALLFKTGSFYIVLNDLKETVLLPQLLISGIVSMCHLPRLPHVFVLVNRVACNPGCLHTPFVVYLAANSQSSGLSLAVLDLRHVPPHWALLSQFLMSPIFCI